MNSTTPRMHPSAKVIGALLLACMALPFTLHAKTTHKVKVKACVGQYALCAASTGTRTDTQAGQDDARACSQNPVSFPLINQ